MARLGQNKAYFTNPVCVSDFSDPDVIRCGRDFYMVCSSFSYCPGVPVYHSYDLIHWELINYVIKDFPQRFHNAVHQGAGAWAPSLRFHDGLYYCLIPFPDEGLFVSTSSNPYKDWSPLRPILEGEGYEDPCPIWKDGKAYVVFAFVKSRIGFNSKLGLLETDENLIKPATDYKIIYDGTIDDPTIEGPKVYFKDGLFYILAPAGGVKEGYEVGLRSPSLYGPYERKVLLQKRKPDDIGPHQGGIVSVCDEGPYAFVHFEDYDELGRILFLQKAEWDKNAWPVIGENGYPMEEGYLDIEENKEVSPLYEADFSKGKVPLMFQTPCQLDSINEFVSCHDDRLFMKTQSKDDNVPFNVYPYFLTFKVTGFKSQVSLTLDGSLLKDGDRCGVMLSGENAAGIQLVREEEKYYLEAFKEDKGVITSLFKTEKLFVSKNSVSIEYDYPDKLVIINREDKKEYTINIRKEHWTGLRFALFSIGKTSDNGEGIFEDLKVSPDR